MGSLANYNQLREERALLEEKTKHLVLDKLHAVNSVGHSVLRKKFGGTEYMREDLSFLGELGSFLQARKFTIVELNEYNIVLEVQEFRGGKKPGRVTLSLKYLRVSDREIAKFIREKVAEHKRSKKRQEAVDAEREVVKLQREIEKQQKEIVRLQNLAKKVREENVRAEAKV